MKFRSTILLNRDLALPFAPSSLASLPRLRSPFWRIVTLATLLSPLLIAVSVSRWDLSFPFPRCLFQWAFGFPAPSCGLTRSMLALAAGDWSQALNYHLFGPIMALLALVLTLSIVAELVTRRSWAYWYERVWRSRTTWMVVGLYMLYYGVRMWVRYAAPSLPWELGETVMWQQFVAGAIAL
ncbi:MAG: DUF2752 domain-containing protein [Cyanobacteria bacterium P01_D01_bin.71]